MRDPRYISTSISIKSRILKKMNELTEMSYGAGDESDQHVQMYKQKIVDTRA